MVLTHGHTRERQDRRRAPRILNSRRRIAREKIGFPIGGEGGGERERLGAPEYVCMSVGATWNSLSLPPIVAELSGGLFSNELPRPAIDRAKFRQQLPPRLGELYVYASYVSFLCRALCTVADPYLQL